MGGCGWRPRHNSRQHRGPQRQLKALTCRRRDRSMVDPSSAVSDNVGAAPDSSAGGACGGPSARQATTTNAQSEGPLGQHLLDAARRQQEAFVGNISSLLTQCSSRNRRSGPALESDSQRSSAESNLSTAVSSRADPHKDELPTKAEPETGGLASLAAFGHGGESHEVHCRCAAPRLRGWRGGCCDRGGRWRHTTAYVSPAVLRCLALPPARAGA